MKQELIDKFQGKSIAIAGFGVEGRAAYKLLSQIDCQLTIIDENESANVSDDIATRLGQSWLEQLDSYDIVLRTSGMQPDKLAGAQQVTTSTDVLLELYGQQTIAVTGTKGKSTTVSLITAILRAAEVNVELVGNIGRSAWEVLAADITSDTAIVAELSSFQLSDVNHSPHIAGLLPITTDHLDWHPSVEHYFSSKLRIITHQTDSDVCITDLETAEQLELSHKTAAKLRITEELIEQTDYQLLTDIGDIELEKLQLRGQHNINDIKLALSTALQWVKDFDTDVNKHWGAIQDTLYEFQPLLYHLEPLGNIKGRPVINDSYASNPTATLAAIKAIDGEKTIIIGGHSKGLPIEPLIKEFDNHNVKTAIIIGANPEQCQEIAEMVGKLSAAKVDIVGEQKMDTIVERALSASGERTTILFSPAHASFDMYTNFTERGRLFSESVKKLHNNAE